MGPAIPTAAQVRKLRVTSVRDFREDLKALGLVVTTGGSKQRVETAGGVLVGAMPLTRATPQALRNCRAWLARRVEDLAANNTPNGRNTP